MAGAALAQTPAAPLTFDVASVKLGAIDQAKIMAGQQHVGLKVEGNRVDIGISSLSELIGMAYKVKFYQIQGPDWLTPTGQRFDILAKMPEGATKDQAPEMLQALLAERFKLTLHRTSKETQVYALIIGKNGLKMKETPPDVPVAPTGDDAPKDTNMKITGTQEKGMTVTNTPAGTQKMTMVDGVMHVEASKMAMSMLAEALSRYVDHPVVDMTELKGNYQVVLDISQEDIRAVMRSVGAAMPAGAGGATDTASEPGSSIVTSVQQLGLRLEARKMPIDMIVIDHLEKLPTEN
ncbi:MAG: TIGR03435 family protein [Bryobacteraceae bacterium]